MFKITNRACVLNATPWQPGGACSCLNAKITDSEKDSLRKFKRSLWIFFPPASVSELSDNCERLPVLPSLRHGSRTAVHLPSQEVEKETKISSFRRPPAYLPSG